MYNLVNPVRELHSLTVSADGGIKAPSALIGNNLRLKSEAFSNGVNKEGMKLPVSKISIWFEFAPSE